jgi:excisionase family DNA binding protein
MSTLTLPQAADLLKIHPVTLQDKARSGEIPAAKIGKCWVFIEVDLLEYIRSQYKRRVLQGEHTEVQLCHSSNAKIHLIGGSKSSPTMDDEYSKALALPTKQKHRSCTTS